MSVFELEYQTVHVIPRWSANPPHTGILMFVLYNEDEISPTPPSRHCNSLLIVRSHEGIKVATVLSGDALVWVYLCRQVGRWTGARDSTG